ncbi:hypothetical protein [Geobacillus stearothermophilus]|uniref:hypothetical protein n=1 Tax=Geobacillus stearothermophilus TaxID=1422 RepID=UPI0018AFE6F7|nr:hypothetical protein [Geobacillus stearothermophilus]MED4995940.1 hypothetical protein [Geobacillus stearothermophilus]
MFGGYCCDEEKESVTRNRVFQTYIDQSVSTRGIVRNMTAKDMVQELVHQLKPIFKGNNHK